MTSLDPPRGDEFRDDLRRAEARRIDAAALARLTTLDDRRSLLAIAQTLALLVAALAAGVAYWSIWVVVPVILVVATQQHALFVLAHEAAHYRLFRRRGQNDLAGRLVASAAGISMCSYRIIHRLHHNNLYTDTDPDIALHGGYPRGRAYLRRKLLADLSGLTAWKTYRYFFGAPALNTATNVAPRPLDDTSPALRRAALADRRGVIAAQIALPLLVLAFAGPAGLAQYVVLWVVPAATVLQAILRVRAIAEHGAPAGLDSPLLAARTNLGNALTRFVLFPHHVNYHIEHHLFPAVPHYRLPQLHALLAREGGLGGAEVRSFRETWRRVYAERATA